MIIEIGLLLGEKVEIVLPTHFVELPAVAAEEIAPVGRLFAVFALAPDVKIGVWCDAAAAFLEPFVLIAGVVNNEIHDDADIPLFRFGDEGIHLLQRTVIGVDIAVIADVIAVILIG